MPQSAHKYRNGFRPTFHPEELVKFRETASRWRKPRRVFVGSMSDIMDPGFSVQQVRDIITVAADFPRHTFMFLTKRPESYSSYTWPRNAWIGVTAPDQAQADWAADCLMGYQHIHYLSCEPMMGAIDMWWHYAPSWVIIGAQTGPGARRNPPQHKWVADLTAQAAAKGVPVFHKDNLRTYFGGEFVLRQFPGTVVRVF
jgi:protein gp37